MCFCIVHFSRSISRSSLLFLSVWYLLECKNLKSFNKEMLDILFDECNKIFPLLYKELWGHRVPVIWIQCYSKITYLLFYIILVMSNLINNVTLFFSPTAGTHSRLLWNSNCSEHLVAVQVTLCPLFLQSSKNCVYNIIIVINQ